MNEHRLLSPAMVRVLPFAVFIALTAFQDSAGEKARYWIYLAKTIAAGTTLLAVRKQIEELQVRFSAPAVLVGIGVFVLWVGLDGFYPSLGDLYAGFICPGLQKIGLAKTCAGKATAVPWNPHVAFGAGSALSLFFVGVRIIGATLVVPFIEEIFWRSFVYRFVANFPLDRESLGKFHRSAFFVTAILFGLEHQEWLAGILCGCAYQLLVLWKQRLGDAIVAHGVTNLLLGAYVVWKGAWHFW